MLIAKRERDRLNAPIFVPDELDSRDAAFAAARAALTATEADEVRGAAAVQTLDEVVGRLLVPRWLGVSAGRRPS